MAIVPIPSANALSVTSAVQLRQGSSANSANSIRNSSARLLPSSASPGAGAQAIDRYEKATYAASRPSARASGREARRRPRPSPAALATSRPSTSSAEGSHVVGS